MLLDADWCVSGDVAIAVDQVAAVQRDTQCWRVNDVTRTVIMDGARNVVTSNGVYIDFAPINRSAATARSSGINLKDAASFAICSGDIDPRTLTLKTQFYGPFEDYLWPVFGAPVLDGGTMTPVVELLRRAIEYLDENPTILMPESNCAPLEARQI